MKHNTINFPRYLTQTIPSLSVVFFLVMGLIATSCDSSTAQNDEAEQSGVTEVVVTKYQNIDVAQFDKLRESNDYVVLDVRTPGEIAAGKIGAAVELDYFAPSFSGDLSKLDKSKKYLIYCKVGGRSAKAAQKMVDMGFSNIYNLQGGYTSWFAASPDNK